MQNWWEKQMTKFLKELMFLGLTFNILGSFLPWKRSGDFISYWTFGINFRPIFKDNGGLIIILLTLISFLIFADSKNNPKILWGVLIINGICLMITLYHIVLIVIEKNLSNGSLGGPVVHVGLIIILFGSTFQILSSLLIIKALWSRSTANIER